MSSRPFLIAALLAVPILGRAAPRELAVDAPASKVTFDVRATLHSFTGNVEVWNATVAWDDSEDRPAAAEFSAALSGLTTGNAKRDREMLHWMESEDHPAIRFHLSGVKPGATGLVAEGDLTIHGVSRPVSIPITLAHDGSRVTVSGEVVVDHRDYGLERVRKFGFLTVDPEVKVAFLLAGVLP